MDAAQITIITTDVAVGSGLLFFYSSVADVETEEAVSETVAVDLAVATTTVIAVNGSSFFLVSSVAAETMVPAANFFSGVVSATPSYIVNMCFVTDSKLDLYTIANIN